MTREEAIKVLSSYDVNGVWADVDGKPYNAEEQAEAFDMAIEALQTPPISQRSMYQAGYRQAQEDRSSGDLISRAEAIEAIEIVDWYHQNRNKDMVSGANSDEHQVWYKAQDIYKALEAVPSADRQKDGDLISRQAATSIPILPKEHRKVFRGEDDAFETGWNEALACVNMLPSADRPRGYWIGDKCSVCGEERAWYGSNPPICPDCGADMRGGEDG